MAFGSHKDEKYQTLVQDTDPPENLEGLEPNKVNVEVWRTMTHKTKSHDVKLQAIQGLLHKTFSILSYSVSDLYTGRNDKGNSPEIIKSTIKRIIDALLLMGKANSNILNLRRESITPELNPSYKQLSFSKEDHPKLLFGDDLPKAIKEISETNKVGYSISAKSNFNNKRGTPFLWKSRGHHHHFHNNQQHSRGKPRQNNYNRYQPYHQRGGSTSRTTTMHNNKQDQ